MEGGKQGLKAGDERGERRKKWRGERREERRERECIVVRGCPEMVCFSECSVFELPAGGGGEALEKSTESLTIAAMRFLAASLRGRGSGCGDNGDHDDS